MAVSAVAILAKSKHLVYKHFEISKTKFGNGFHIGFSLFRSDFVLRFPVFFVSAVTRSLWTVSSVSVFADHLHSWLPSLRAQGYRLADALTHYNRSVKQAAS